MSLSPSRRRYHRRRRRHRHRLNRCERNKRLRCCHLFSLLTAIIDAHVMPFEWEKSSNCPLMRTKWKFDLRRVIRTRWGWHRWCVVIKVFCLLASNGERYEHFGNTVHGLCHFLSLCVCRSVGDRSSFYGSIYDLPSGTRKYIIFKSIVNLFPSLNTIFGEPLCGGTWATGTWATANAWVRASERVAWINSKEIIPNKISYMRLTTMSIAFGIS